MDKIFIDSNFFIALANPKDSLHQKAVSVSDILQKNSSPLCISNYIFLETVTVISQRVGREEAISRGKQLLDESFSMIQVDLGLQNAAWEIFCETPKKNTSFVDCSTIAAMLAEGIDKLLTFDQEDFKPLLKKHHLSLF